MPRDTSHHTTARKYRLSDETIEALNRVAEHYQFNRTSAMRYLIHAEDARIRGERGAEAKKERE